MAEKKPWQKWSIWYLLEHFLVPEHRIPIWLGLVLRFTVGTAWQNGCYRSDTPKWLKFHWFYWHFEISKESWIHKTLIFTECLKHNDSMTSIRHSNMIEIPYVLLTFWNIEWSWIRKNLIFTECLKHNKDMSTTKPLFFVAKINKKTPWTRWRLAT